MISQAVRNIVGAQHPIFAQAKDLGIETDHGLIEYLGKRVAKVPEHTVDLYMGLYSDSTKHSDGTPVFPFWLYQKERLAEECRKVRDAHAARMASKPKPKKFQRRGHCRPPPTHH